MNNDEIINKAFNEVYKYYEMENSLTWNRFIHPMFYNETFSENNEYRPPKPDELLNKEEFMDKFIKSNDETKWKFLYEFLCFFIYKNKQKFI